MTSAVIAGRNEVHHHPHWGDSRVPHMPKPPNPNPRRHRPSPNPRPSVPPAPEPAPPADAAVTGPSPSGHVTIRPSRLSRREARELRARLTGELGRVRALLSQIDTWEAHRRPPGPEPELEPQLRHVAPSPALQAAMRKRCSQILTRLRKQKVCHWFNNPVDVEGLKLHDYRAIIRNPMDLGTVKQNLAAGWYPSHEAFAADVRLTFNNALRYNPPDHNVHKAAGNLLTTFEDLYMEAVSWFELECRRIAPRVPQAWPLPPVPPPQQPPVPMPTQVPPKLRGGKMPKPKAREPNKRGMSMDEMEKLKAEIMNLPEEKTVNVLQIVRKRNTDLELSGDSVELDFEEMDVETLWELDRFVVNWKKVLNKSQRNVVINGDAVDETAVVPVDDDMVLVNVNVSPGMVVDIGDSEDGLPEKRAAQAEMVDEYVDIGDEMKREIEAEMVDEYVDIGDEMPTANYQSVEIEKDAQMVSSSSGSGSGSSSSSDSYSRSSGGSDSDGDDAQSPD